jgi:hypothetical protein
MLQKKKNHTREMMDFDVSDNFSIIYEVKNLYGC